MAIEFPEDRAEKRLDYISPLQIKELTSGEIYDVRMLNYSKIGFYFESDGFFQKGAKIYICIQNSPYSPKSGVLDYYHGEVVWRKDLKQSFLNYGYGVKLVSDLRRHPRKPYFQKVQLVAYDGIYEGRTKNISASGAFIATEEKLEVGQLIRLNLPLKNGKTTKIIGQIVWMNAEGFSLKFQKVK